MNDKLLTIQETANYLQVHYQSVRNYIEQGKIPATKIGRIVRIRLSDVENFAKDNQSHDEINELEIRFFTNRRKKIEKFLLENDAEIIYHGHIIDHWYVPTSIKTLKEKDEYFESGFGFGIRIREQDNGYTGKITTSMEVKRLVTPYQHEHCIEQELQVSNFDEADRFLSLSNTKRFITINKDRLVYKYKQFKVVLDDIKDYGTGIEIEIMTAKNKDKVWPELVKTAYEIGLKENELVEKSVTHMVMAEKSKF